MEYVRLLLIAVIALSVAAVVFAIRAFLLAAEAKRMVASWRAARNRPDH